MPLPTQSKVEIPLLDELDKAGGRATPQEIIKRVTARFPGISERDLALKLASGANQWVNRVRWVRQSLVMKGELDRSTRGIWAITEAGRKRLQAYRTGSSYTQPKTKAKSRKPSRVTKKAMTDHDAVARALEKMGKAFGFDSKWKPKVNDLRPNKSAFKSKRKTLDVAWQVANLAWVPIEVQVSGSVADLLYRFNQVHQWSLRLIVVTVLEHRDEIREAMSGYPFADKVILLTPDKVVGATRSLDRLLQLKAEIFE